MMIYVKNVKRIFCIFSKNQQFLSHASVIAFVIVTGCLESWRVFQDGSTESADTKAETRAVAEATI